MTDYRTLDNIARSRRLARALIDQQAAQEPAGPSAGPETPETAGEIAIQYLKEHPRDPHGEFLLRQVSAASRRLNKNP